MPPEAKANPEPEHRNRWCGLAGRSFTDLLSNVVFLAPLSSPTDLASLPECRLEAHRLTELMHEFVHHQSLLSPVGYALCLLGFGSQRMAWIMNETRNQILVNAFVSRFLRFEVATTVLRPLGEGLALFAEHDIYPGNKDPRSLLALITDFFGAGFYPQAIADHILSTKLSMARMSDFEKKAGLLSLPFSAKGGGYALGYCVMKRLWRMAAEHDSYFKDADNFFKYCLGVLFGNVRLVCQILEIPGKEVAFNPHSYAEKISSEAIQTLLRFFGNPALPQLRTSIQHALTARRDDLRSHHPIESANDLLEAAVFGPEEIDRANTLLREWGNRQNNPEYFVLHSDLPRGLVELQNAMLNSRNVFRLMSLPVQWQVRGRSIKLSGKSFRFECNIDTAPPSEPAIGDGTVEVVFLYPECVYVPVLITDHWHLPLTTLLRGNKSTSLADVLPLIVSLSQSVKRDQDLAGWMHDTKLCVMPGEGWEKLEREVEDATSATYVSSIASHFAPAREAEFVAASRADGLLGILQSEDLVRIAAITSTLAVFDPPLDHFVEGLTVFGRDLQSVNALNERYRSICGIDAVQITPSCVSSLY